MKRNQCLLTLLILALMILMLSVSTAKTDPSTGRIRLIAVGNQWQDVNRYPLGLLRSDPRIFLLSSIETANGLPADEVRKRLRIKFPRTKARFSSEVDVLQLMFSPPWVFTGEQQQWIHDSIYEDGVGLVLIHMGWQPCLTDPMLYCNRPQDWMNSVIYDAWPMNVVIGESSKPGVGLEIVTRTPVVDLPDFEKQPIGFTGNAGPGLIYARPGATVHAKWRVGGEDAIVSTNYGEGITLCLPIMDFMFQNPAIRDWKYHVDMVLNRIYFPAGVPVPEDLELGHTLRANFKAFYERKGMMISLIDFIDRFGANTASLNTLLDELEAQRKEASQSYMKGNYQEALDQMQEALDGLASISSESMRLRQRALFWIYITEYLIVSGTAMLSGFVIWTLMIKRRYYREINTTRLSEIEN